MPLTNALKIKGNGSAGIKLSDLKNSYKKNREMNGENEWAENFGLLPDCNGWIRECGTFAGKTFNKVDALDFFGKESFVQTNLDLNKAGKAVLSIEEEGRSATWEFEPTTDSNEPIYLKILITDYYVGVTHLENGFLTFTSTTISNENPQKDYGFNDFIGNEKFLFQRPNKWLSFKAAYKAFTDVRSSANTKTCEIFGEKCDGTSSWAIIENKYKSVYEDDVSPMLEELQLYTNNSDLDVRRALLMLAQTADLLASCYFRTQLAAHSKNDTAYNAVSSCWEDVNQKIGEIEIFVSDFGVQLNLNPRLGDF